MNKIIVPVDFSETAANAAKFAAYLSKGIREAELIVYNVFGTIEAGSDGSPLQSDDTARKSIMEFALQIMKKELARITDAKISIVVEKDDHFVDSLERYVRHNGVQLIVMGITGATRLGQIFMGSNTLRLVNRRTVPVVIVPPDAQFKDAKNIMLISDFKDVERTIPVAQVKGLLNLFKPTLHIVNVDAEHYIELTDEYKAERSKMDDMLKEFSPEYSFIRLFDFMDTINQVAKDKNIDMIITFPKEHSFLSNIFKTSHTKKLVYHSDVPIVAIHS
ncbi:MAG TPA: universal stress protein [Puia sp.]|nr:universal stress protein [Puia sp.]